MTSVLGVLPEIHRRTDDVRIRELQEITLPVDLIREAPVPDEVLDLVSETRAAIGRILAGEDLRLLVVIGPCSIHDTAAAVEYARAIQEFSRQMREWMLIVMRVYFEKPRTRCGWKGLINDPYLNGTCQINEGLRLARRLLLEINSLGVPTATEFLDPITPQYIGDLISWAAIGARTTESQVHRELASGLSCPVGFKNSTSGDTQVAVNAVVAASRPQQFLGITKSGKAAIVSTTGNKDCHIILRGGPRPNYDEASVRNVAAHLVAEGLPPRLMVDCSHGNCAGDYRRQLVVAQEVARQRRAGIDHVCGLMAESNLLSGRQAMVIGRPLVPGLSLTDACLGLDETARLLDEFVNFSRP
jgi:3-deoxy-7-phosphoheptulonate synthase